MKPHKPDPCILFSQLPECIEIVGFSHTVEKGFDTRTFYNLLLSWQIIINFHSSER